MSYLKNNPHVQPEQEPTEPATPAPAPEVTPKRRRFIQPVFSTRPPARAGRPVRMAITCALTLLMSGAFAQTDNTNSKGQSQPTTPGTSTQQGWTMWNDQMGRELNIPADQLTRLREVDERYATEYRALGTNPTTNPNYRALTERRTNDIRGILANDVFTRWEKHYGGAMMNDRTNKVNPDGTTPKSTTANPGGNNSSTETSPPKQKTTTP